MAETKKKGRKWVKSDAAEAEEKPGFGSKGADRRKALYDHKKAK